MNSLQHQNRIAELVFGSSKHLICAVTLDCSLKIRFATETFKQIYKAGPGETIAHSFKLSNYVQSLMQFPNGPSTCVIDECFEENTRNLFVVSYLPQENTGAEEDKEVMLFLCDVTPLQHEYEANLQGEMSRLVGEMAAGTANHILNPLAVIKGSLQLIEEKLTANDSITSRIIMLRINKHLALASQQVEQIHNHIQRMIRIGKPFEMELGIINLSSFFTEFIFDVQKASMDGGCKLSCEFPSIDANLLANREYLKQALLELISNAIEASRKGGQIHVGAEVTESAVIFRIRDEGGGIIKECADRAKLPFYTTKENSLGLGLSFCDVIFRNMDAIMTINGGDNDTMVTVSIPRLKD